MPRWDRELAGRLISRWKVTGWTNIPTMVIDLLGSPNFASFDLSSLTSIGGGGAAMPQAVAQRLLEQYGLYYVEGYGLTETAAPSHNNPPDNPKQQCLGVPIFGTDSRVVDPETLKEMPQGEQGEIIIHGPQVFRGYWQQPEATAKAFIEFEGKPFFRSGDLGRVDEDGYFFITDRLKRMINASGFKVWPAEVETLMFKHPAIQEACIISTKDAYRGGFAGQPQGNHRARHHRLVPRQHGRLQNAACGAVCGCVAQNRQRQSLVAQFAGGGRQRLI
jgi:fatty-acyl-CoA synthase